MNTQFMRDYDEGYIQRWTRSVYGLIEHGWVLRGELLLPYVGVVVALSLSLGSLNVRSGCRRDFF